MWQKALPGSKEAAASAAYSEHNAGCNVVGVVLTASVSLKWSLSMDINQAHFHTLNGLLHLSIINKSGKVLICVGLLFVVGVGIRWQYWIACPFGV